MTKIKLWCDSGANIHSCNEEIVDTVSDWGYNEGEWETMSEDEKQKVATEWAWESAGLEIGVTEVTD